ncbi:transposable element Tcb2 transposase [Trichonephila clavipes]|nr:transposable element Tcb2 transposase [Trichonephila clavipes]
MNRRSPYSKPPDAFMCGERPKKHLLLNALCRLLSMEVGPLWYGGRYLGVVLDHLLLCIARLKLPTMSISWGIRCIHLSRLHFPENAQDNNLECQEDNAPIHTAKIVQEWFAEHEGEVGHLDWPPQSSDLNIIEHLWGYLESKLRARFPPPSTISALQTALHEEWLHIPLQVVHDLYASIPRRIQSVIQSKGGPTPY